MPLIYKPEASPFPTVQSMAWREPPKSPVREQKLPQQSLSVESETPAPDESSIQRTPRTLRFQTVHEGEVSVKGGGSQVEFPEQFTDRHSLTVSTPTQTEQSDDLSDDGNSAAVEDIIERVLRKKGILFTGERANVSTYPVEFDLSLLQATTPTGDLRRSSGPFNTATSFRSINAKPQSLDTPALKTNLDQTKLGTSMKSTPHSLLRTDKNS